MARGIQRRPGSTDREVQGISTRWDAGTNRLSSAPIAAPIASATSNFIIGVSAAASAYVYFRKGLIPLELTAMIVTGVLIGSFLGIYALYKARSEKLQLVFSALVLLVGIKMLLAAL